MKVTVIATGFDRAADRRVETPAAVRSAVEAWRPGAARSTVPQPEVQVAIPERSVASEPLHEPMAHEPMAHEPMAHEPMTHEPLAHEPVVRQPIVREPLMHEPVARESMRHEPVRESMVHESSPQESLFHDPAAQQELAPEEPARDEEQEKIPFYRKVLAQRHVDDPGGYGPNWSNVDDYDIPTVLRKQMD